MAIRDDVRFRVDGGIELGAWLYLPESGKHLRPAITMAHGYAGTREHGIAKFTEAFADAGFVVLLHDHRTFGVSDGEPRQDVDPWRQIADWRREISYLESRPEVDASRIGLWVRAMLAVTRSSLAPLTDALAVSSRRCRQSADMNKACATLRQKLSPRSKQR